MAILKDTRGIEVTVMVSGKKTIEYEADNDRMKSLTKYSCPTSTKYIESKDNAKFTIAQVLSCPDPYELPVPIFPNTDRVILLKTRSVDDSNDERLARDLRVVKNLGLITVTVERCTTHRSRSRAPAARETFSNEKKTFNLSAKSMKGKAISHGTAFSSAQKIRTPRSVTTRPLPKDKGRPIAVFNFLYRSKDALQQSLVIPRELPPVADEPKSDAKRSPIDEKKCIRKVDEPASRARAFDDLSPAERERLARERFDQMQTGVKQEGVKLEHDSKPGKRKFEEAEDSKERASNPRRVKRPAQFVDLTLD
ncbi:hypothetical protein NPX13_g5947 [Xylaria arbuscula]|uniref:DUF7918 domain-containing protein n=1 Tax=Xylaria arbuscula TaxID=114810 RepID=A0A9W8TKK5_9PEZI|nr:hypothetical protein NPX13_g5947 [Xylaria arbuscula]